MRLYHKCLCLILLCAFNVSAFRRTAKAAIIASKGNTKHVLAKLATRPLRLAPDVVALSSPTNVVAKLLGYVIGLGSMTVYSPIIISLLKSKSAAEGLAIQTWIFNLVGITVAAAYPFQKGFLLSTYIELLFLAAQSFCVLGLLLHYQQRYVELAVGVTAYTALLFLLFARKLPVSVQNWLQISSSIICNYANIPQILLTMRIKRAEWSRVTSLLSTVGNLVRVFTTIKLTNDPLFLFGYALGATSNAILFIQTFIYNSN